WLDIGGLDVTAVALATDRTNLFVGGEFTRAGGTSANGIAKWDGAQWTTLADNSSRVSISSLLFAGGVLYAGGSFSSVDGVKCANIAAWDGAKWSALGSGIPGIVL